MVLRSFFMANLVEMDGGIACSSAKENAIKHSNTALRRMQHKHSQRCYQQMKEKLLSLLLPLPKDAIHAVDVEQFRETLYYPIDDNNTCLWCGSWHPLPRNHYVTLPLTEPASSRPHISRARHIFLPTLSMQYPENVPAAKLYTIEIVPAPADKASCTLDLAIEDFLQPSLCNAVCAIGFGEGEQALHRQLRKQRAAALKARWVGRQFTGLSWLDK